MTWTVLRVDRVVDGDTVRLIRQRDIGLADGFTITATDAQPVACRLLWVDTPERGEHGWGDAKADLEQWIADTKTRLIAVDHGPDHFGRRLTDLQDETGDSASQFLIRECGWLPYLEGK